MQDRVEDLDLFDKKAARAFRTISEVSSELNISSHVLRFWEKKFSELAPVQRAGGRRYYRPEDISLLKKIEYLLHKEGYTIKGVQKLLKEGTINTVVENRQKGLDADGGDSSLSLLGSDLSTEAEQAEGLNESSSLGHEMRAELGSIISELEEIQVLLREGI